MGFLIRPYKSFEDAIIDLNSDLIFNKNCFTGWKTEKLICKILETLKIKYNTQFIVCDSPKEGQFKMDIFIPEYNLIIEIDGCQHFEGRRTWHQRLGWKVAVSRDVFKMQHVLKKGISVIRIVQQEAFEGKELWFDTFIKSYIHSYETPIIHYITTSDMFKDIYTNHKLYMDKEISDIDLY